jgi:hypothetical protein
MHHGIDSSVSKAELNGIATQDFGIKKPPGLARWRFLLA